MLANAETMTANVSGPRATCQAPLQVLSHSIAPTSLHATAKEVESERGQNTCSRSHRSEGAEGIHGDKVHPCLAHSRSPTNAMGMLKGQVRWGRLRPGGDGGTA